MEMTGCIGLCSSCLALGREELKSLSPELSKDVAFKREQLVILRLLDYSHFSNSA